MFVSISALSLLWLAWLVSWLLASRWSGQTVARQSAGSRIAQSVPIWAGALLLFRAPGGVWERSLVPTNPWVHTGALLLAVLGFALTWWARIHLGRLWSGAVTLKADHAIVRSGPYALTRHPIYTGLLLAVLATVLDRDTVAALVGFGLIVLGLVLKLRQEEAILRSKFGSAYDVYAMDVPALIPHAW